MRTDRRACLGTSTPPAPDRRRPGRRLRPAPGCGTRRCESGRRSSALTRAGTGSRPVPLHLHHGADLDEAVALEDRAALGDLRRLGDVLRLDDGVAADQVLRFRERAVCHRLLFAGDDLAGGLERLAGVLDVALLAQLLKPGHPLLHDLLRLLRGRGPLGAPVKEQVLAHLVLLLAVTGVVRPCPGVTRSGSGAGSMVGRSRARDPDTFLRMRGREVWASAGRTLDACAILAASASRDASGPRKGLRPPRAVTARQVSTSFGPMCG